MNSINMESKIYKFEGILFEIPFYMIAVSLNKNLLPSNKRPKNFENIMEKFDKLSDIKKEKFRIQ